MLELYSFRNRNGQFGLEDNPIMCVIRLTTL